MIYVDLIECTKYFKLETSLFYPKILPKLELHCLLGSHMGFYTVLGYFYQKAIFNLYFNRLFGSSEQLEAV